jgi:hypothetical protein
MVGVALGTLLTACLMVADAAPRASAQGNGNVETGHGSVPASTPTRSPSAPRARAPAPAAAPSPAATIPAQQTPKPGVTGSPTTPAPRPSSGESPAATRKPPREPSSRALRRLVKPVSSCLGALRLSEERVIVRRAGLRGLKGGTRTAVARRLGVSRARVAPLERRALRTLHTRARAGNCTNKEPKGSSDLAASKPANTSTPEGRPAVTGQVGAATKSARSYADEHPAAFVLAMLVALVCGLLLVRELRRSF